MYIYLKGEMHMSLKIMVDSTFNLEKEFIEENDITVVPLNVIIGEENYIDGEISLDKILDSVLDGKKVTTSQPSPLLFEKAFKNLRDEGATDILCLTLSSTLSGTHQAALLGAEDVEGVNIVVYDTLSASIGSEIFANVAVRELKNNSSLNEIIDKLDVIRKNSGILIALKDLTALKKSGRISRLRATIGNLLRVKPVVEYFEGKVSITSKFRTDSQVFKWIIDKMKSILDNVKTKIHIIVTDIRAMDRIKKIQKSLKEAFPKVDIRFTDVGITPVIAVNIGYGGFGVAWSYE